MFKKTLFVENNDGKYTNWGQLLSDQSPIVVKLVEYDKEMNFKIKKSFSDSLLKALYELEEQVNRLNDTKVIFDRKSFTRIETKSYPGAAFERSNFKCETKCLFYPYYPKFLYRIFMKTTSGTKLNSKKDFN